MHLAGEYLAADQLKQTFVQSSAFARTADRGKGKTRLKPRIMGKPTCVSPIATDQGCATGAEGSEANGSNRVSALR